MNSFIGFIIENTLVHAAPIFAAALVFSLIVGPILINVGVNKFIRTGIYAVIGVIAGIINYSANSIPDRDIEIAEALSLSIGMLIFSLIIITPIVLFKNRAKKT